MQIVRPLNRRRQSSAVLKELVLHSPDWCHWTATCKSDVHFNVSAWMCNSWNGSAWCWIVLCTFILFLVFVAVNSSACRLWTQAVQLCVLMRILNSVSLLKWTEFVWDRIKVGLSPNLILFFWVNHSCLKSTLYSQLCRGTKSYLIQLAVDQTWRCLQTLNSTNLPFASR